MEAADELAAKRDDVIDVAHDHSGEPIHAADCLVMGRSEPAWGSLPLDRPSGRYRRISSGPKFFVRHLPLEPLLVICPAVI